MEQTLNKVSNTLGGLGYIFLILVIGGCAVASFVLSVQAMYYIEEIQGFDGSYWLDILEIPAFMLGLTFVLFIYAIVFYYLAKYAKKKKEERLIKWQEDRAKALVEIKEDVLKEIQQQKEAEIEYLDLTPLKKKQKHHKPIKGKRSLNRNGSK